MKNSNVLTGIALLLCLSCSNVKETPKGFRYTVVKKGDGILAKPGQFLIMSMVFKDGKVVDVHGEGHNQNIMAVGAATPLKGKTVSWTSKPIGPGRFSVDYSVP